MNKWLIQTSGFKTNIIEAIIENLQKLNIEYNDFGLINGCTTITNLENILEPDYNYVTRGGIKFLKLITDTTDLHILNEHLSEEQYNPLYLTKLMKSIDYDINKFDQLNYSKLNLPLLNNNAMYVPYNNIKTQVFNKDMFMKPSKDLKSFNGGIIPADETLLNYVYRTGFMKEIEDEIVVVADVQKIYYEYRFFMYQDYILGSSRYMMNGTVSPDTYVPHYIMDAAKEYSKLYNPMELYVMDLAETDRGIKIVEYNCWNASGFYHSNIRDIIFQVNEIKGNKNG